MENLTQCVRLCQLLHVEGDERGVGEGEGGRGGVSAVFASMCRTLAVSQHPCVSLGVGLCALA